MIERSDLIVPLDRDFDGDPLQDDEVLLRTSDGTLLRRLLSSDADVTDDPDKGLRFYRFRNLRYGLYHVWIVVGGQEREAGICGGQHCPRGSKRSSSLRDHRPRR
jgi:hypothetical protein